MKIFKKSLIFLKKILITVILVILISSFLALEDQNKEITPYLLNQILKEFAEERNLVYDEHAFWN